MANTTINVDALTAEQKIHLPPSPALSRFSEILNARHQPWCDYRVGDKEKLKLKPYTEEDLASVIENLEHYELARALFGAALHGDLKIAQAVWSARGPFEVVHEHHEYFELINGTSVRQATGANHRFTNPNSLAEVKELLEWLPTVGFGFMTGVGSEHAILLESSYLKMPISQLAHKVAYTGDLPTLSDGVVSNPELMLALSDQARVSNLPEAYDDILCWVPNEQVAQFQDHLKPFVVHQGLSLTRQKTAEEGTGFHRQRFALSECTNELFEQVSSRGVTGGRPQHYSRLWSFNSFDMRLEPAAGLKDYHSEAVLPYQASPAIIHGFDHKPGHTLCHTSVKFLTNFMPDRVDPAQLQKALKFAESYFPLDLLCIATEGIENCDPSCLRIRTGFMRGQGRGVSDFNDLLGFIGDDSPIKEQVRREVPRALFDFMANLQCELNLNDKTLLAMKQGLGVDNTGFGVRLDSKGIQRLHDAGYQFSPETVTHLPQRHSPTGRQLTYERMSHTDTEVYLHLSGEYVTAAGSPKPETPELKNAYQNALRMNLWPAETPRPENLRKAIIQAAAKKKPGDSNNDRALRAWFDLEGIENCIKAADTVSQVDFLRRHFGHNEVKPYLGLTSRKIRVRLVEDDLGM